MLASDLSRLADPFAPSDIDWKPGTVTRDKSKGLAMAYLTSRAVQERLDTVCGPADWRNEFREGPGGGVLCGLSIYVQREPGELGEWVTKWDGAENTAVDGVKGGLSGALKRAAVMWGVGRYLYELPAQWVRLDERGRFAETPRLPSSAATRPAPSPRPAPAAPASHPAPAAPESRPSTGTPAPRGPMAGERRVVRPAGDGASGQPRLGRTS